MAGFRAIGAPTRRIGFPNDPSRLKESLSMSRSRQAVGICIVALFGIWGCSRTPSADGNAATAEKLKAVETKLARLEDDFRAAASARDQLSKKLIAAEEARTALHGQVERLIRESKAKDAEIATRTTERDQLSGQYKMFREGIREWLAKADEGKMDGSPTAPVIPTSNSKQDVPAIPIPPPGK
jgi:septal ring factor EnvC (AmiA/AmiB activator)